MGDTQHGQGEGSVSNRSRWMIMSMVVLGAVAAVIGLVLLLVPSGQASLGWFAYSPLSNTTFFPPAVLFSSYGQIGIVLVPTGLIMLAFAAGWMLSQRQTASQRREPNPSGPGT